MSRARRLHWPTAGVALATLLGWVVIALALTTCRTADAAPAVAWDRSYAVGDSLTVPVRWAPSCDGLGCATSYRVTWTWGDPIEAAPARNDASDGASIAVAVIRDTTVTDPRDSVRVPLPAIGQPQVVCVSIVAVRRGLASDARRGCRTIEAPDAPPPPVDSITWDSIAPVLPLTLDLARDSMGDTLMALVGRWQYRRDSAGVLDSIETPRVPVPRLRDPASGLVLVPAHDVQLTPGWTSTVCAAIVDRAGAAAFVMVPGVLFQSPAMVHRHQQVCGEALALDYPQLRPRWVSDALPDPGPTYTDTLPSPSTRRAPPRSGA